MQKLLLADDLFPAMLAGKKKATIRAGKRDIEPGPLVMVATNGGYEPKDVEVTRVTYMAFGLLSEREAVFEGCTVAELNAAMLCFYPDLKASGIVTVIEFV